MAVMGYDTASVATVITFTQQGAFVWLEGAHLTAISVQIPGCAREGALPVALAGWAWPFPMVPAVWIVRWTPALCVQVSGAVRSLRRHHLTRRAARPVVKTPTVPSGLPLSPPVDR